MGILTMSDIDKEKILQGRMKKGPMDFCTGCEGHIEHGTTTAHDLITQCRDENGEKKRKLGEISAVKRPSWHPNLL